MVNGESFDTMQVSQSTLLLAVAVLAGGGYALMRDGSSSDAPRTVEAPAQGALDPGAGVEETDPTEGDPFADPGSEIDPAPDDEPASLTWTAPPAWRTVPSPSAMRIATYAVPHSAGDSADAEVSVTRAGGDVASNIERWADQFHGAAEPKRQSDKVRGLEVTVVEIEGTYTNAMDPGAKPLQRWALLGAIVNAPGQPYFFKMTGPAATVHAARGAFTTLIHGIRPVDG